MAGLLAAALGTCIVLDKMASPSLDGLMCISKRGDDAAGMFGRGTGGSDVGRAGSEVRNRQHAQYEVGVWASEEALTASFMGATDRCCITTRRSSEFLSRKDCSAMRELKNEPPIVPSRASDSRCIASQK